VGLSQWVEPSIEDTLKLLARTGVKEALVVPIAFTSEHLETLFELDLEVIPYAKKLGITNIKRCPAPNDHPTFIRA
jgi:ferrochelatase